MTGHTLGAAGAIESLACIQALRTGVLPPTDQLRDTRPRAATSTTCPTRPGPSPSTWP